LLPNAINLPGLPVPNGMIVVVIVLHTGCMQATAGLGKKIYSVGVDTGSPAAAYFDHLSAAKVGHRLSLF
jgi:hypothetical protein